MERALEGIISEYDEEFNGIVVEESGVSVIIPGVMKGERVRYHIEHKSPHCAKAWGRCDGLLKASPSRVKAVCSSSWPSSGSCSGCPLMHISSEMQNELKSELVLKALHSRGINYIRHIDYTPSKDVVHYRNRTDLVVSERRGRLILGSYKARSHEVVETKYCTILRSPLNQMMSYLCETANRMRIPAYKAASQPGGALRYVSFFANENGEVLIDLVCRSASGSKPAWVDDFAKALSEFSPVRGISYSLNDSEHNALRVSESKTMYGLSRISEAHGSIVSLYSASGFTQLNSGIAAVIYGRACVWLSYRPGIVWDLYCGVGAFGRTVSPLRALYGAEYSASAIQAARLSSQNDEFESHFEVMDLEKTWPDWPHPDVVLVDPPRKGLCENVIGHLLELKPGVVIYMSCNPETFAGDVLRLSSAYVLEKIEAFDMMPQTRHVEVLGMLRAR